MLQQDCLTKIISVWGINISLRARTFEYSEVLAQGKRRCGKRRVAIQTFSRELRENFSA
jgi:hypothetical protein